ncbi:MAG TPA: cobalt-precorrin-6A reductase [Pseudonocardiaceae bacterium]|nr:cobalt-precorrin-6A reductase [Pseudonocardiaceae bacterium]
MDSRVLLLGGTAEAAWIARELSEWPGVHVITSLAGRVRAPSRPPGQLRIGGFGGRAGLLRWLRDQQIDAVVDATHPFAAAITAAAAEVTEQLGVPFVLLRRPGWQAGPGDDWHWVGSLDEAAARLPGLGRRVFLTTGRTGLAAFAVLDDVWFLVRAISPPAPLPARCAVILDRGPFTVSGELELLRRHRIDVLVTKDSGAEMTAAKLVAARRLAVPVLLVRRPPLPVTPAVQVMTTGAEVLSRLRGVLGSAAQER